METSNVKAMRDALELCHRVIHCAIVADILRGDDTYDALKKSKAALTEPPRNCDVGTAEDQYNRFVYSCTSGKIPCRKSELCSCTNCYAEWAQLSYEGNESEVDNENNEKE